MLSRVRGRIRRSLPFALGALTAFAAMFAYLQIDPPEGRLSDDDVRRLADERIASVTPAPPPEPSVYATLRPSVVMIQVAGSDPSGTSFTGRGAGVVVDEEGRILTSHHVIADASSVTVRFFDGSTTVGRVTQQQPERDLAVVQVQRLPNGVGPAALGGDVSPGDPVIAIGSPYGLDGSVTSGIVSGLGRRYTVNATGQTLDNMIQFDAAVNPGNSGGPLVDMAGRVVGIVTGIANPTEQGVFIGLGFAVPIEAAGGVLPPVG